MKPLKLELKAFGPFPDYQAVDFEQLSRKGIFLIKGNTGSGKTTIFDAMTFALYGGSSGEDAASRKGRNDLEEWRCTQADDRADTFIALTFSVHGKKYFFKRSLTPKVKNLSAGYEAGELDENGNLLPFFNNPRKDDLNKKAEELIGLTKEQFRQVVLLPQGQFERFLTASSDEKEGILRKIFGAELWDKYAQAFYNEAKDRKDWLDAEKRDVDSALSEESVGTLEMLEEKLASIKADKEKGKKTHAEFDGAGKRQQLNNDLLLADRFKALREAEAKAEGLNRKKADMDALRERYQKAEKAEKLREPIFAFEAAQTRLHTRIAALKAYSDKLPEAMQNEADARQKKTEHEKNSPVEELTKKVGEYEQKAQAYIEYQTRKEACHVAVSRFHQAETAAEKAGLQYENAKEAAKGGKLDFDAAEQTARDLRNRYFSGIYGELASQLTDGEDCPVCGSKEHPHPAEKTADSVSKEEMEAAQENADAKKKLWDRSEALRSAAEQKQKAAENERNERDKEKTDAEAKLEAAEKNLIDGIADETALKQRINAMKALIKAYNSEAEELQKKLSAASDALTTLNEAIRNAGEEKQRAEEDYRHAEDVLNGALRDNGYADLSAPKADMAAAGERQEMHADIIAYDTDVKTQNEAAAQKRRELAGLIEPDESGFENRERAIAEEEKEFNRKDAELHTHIVRLSDKLQVLQQKWKHYKGNIQQAESDLAFARKLRGDTGIGIQRYVLAIMFNQVIGEANRMLENVHGGRYRLFRSDDSVAGSKRKRGLELKVHDNRSPEKNGRSVSMLSGGEKFLVSLALSIGMSTVAQKTGVQIETLFIDEGFGTLDDSSIRDAMNVLESVRRTSGTIGIISHVPLLEATIPTHLEVVKKDSGSAIVPN